MKKQILAGYLSFLMCFQMVIPTFAVSNESVQISIIEKPKVDVILTASTKTIDLTNFENDLKAELSNRGINTSDLVLQAVETTTSSTSAEDVDFAKAVNSWKSIGSPVWHANNNGQVYIDLSAGSSSYSSAWTPAQNYNSCKPGWYGEALINDKEDSLEDLTMDFTLDAGGTLLGGITFNTTIEDDGSLSGYFFTISQHSGNCYLWKMDHYAIDDYFSHGANAHIWCGGGGYNGQGTAWWTGTQYRGNTTQLNTEIVIPNAGINSNITSRITCLASWNRTTNRANYHVSYTSKDGHIIIQRDGTTVANLYDTTYPTGTYGFWGNNCEQKKSMYISNLKTTAKKTVIKTFNNILLEPTWRDDADHIIVNVNEALDDSFTNSQIKGEILTRTINDNIDFVQWGSASNKKVMENFIKENNDNGLFIGVDSYENAINATANYISGKYEVEENINKTILVNTSVDINVSPEKFKSNTTDIEYPNGKWIIHHDYKYFDNNEGQYKSADVYLDTIPDNITFDKVGKYDITFGDEIAQTIYVHRKPIANFSVKVNNDNTVSFVSSSYDLDSNVDNGLGKGIIEEEWTYKKLEDSSWTSGKPTEILQAGESYVFQLRVKDNLGEWSDYASKFITLDSNIKLPPVAQFGFENSKIFKNDNLVINNSSYDPAGKIITKQNWVLKKDGKEIGAYSTPITDFSTLGVGNYSYTLSVTNSDNIVSDGYTKSFVVVEDKNGPVITIDPTYCDWKENQDININVEDNESGLYRWKYCYTQSQSTPEDSAYGEWQTSQSVSLKFDTDGEYYLHIIAFDNAGNSSQRTVGTYKITHPYTNKVTHHFGIIDKEEYRTYDWGKWYSPVNEFKLNINGFKPKDSHLYNYPNTGMILENSTRIKQPSSSIEFDFYYEPEVYTVEYDYVIDCEPVNEQTTYTVLEGFKLNSPHKDGYTFTGWILDEKYINSINYNLNNEFEDFDAFKNSMNNRISGNIKLKASWAQIEDNVGCNVFATISDEYKVTIPKTIVISGKTGEAQYCVKAEGDIAGIENICIVPDNTVALHSINKEDVIAQISQDKTSWTYDDLGTQSNGWLKATLTAGKWSGNFNFNIYVENNEENINSEENVEYQTITMPIIVK